MSYDYWYKVSKARSDKCWEKYWDRAKQNITRDIPVITIINMNELYNDSEKIFYPDWIVLVGFNETNGTVCCNIPGRGAYIYFSKESLKNAIYQAFVTDKFYRTVYFIETFENISKPPLSPKGRFEKAHGRNIERIKGNTSAYDQDLFRDILRMRIFGLNALKHLKNDYNLLNLALFNLLPGSHYLTPWTSLGSYWMILVEKYNASQYLWEVYDQNLSSTIWWDAKYLELESDLWSHMFHLMRKLNHTISSNRFLKAIILARPLIKELKDTIGTIISIEKAIIEGPPMLN